MSGTAKRGNDHRTSCARPEPAILAGIPTVKTTRTKRPKNCKREMRTTIVNRTTLVTTGPIMEFAMWIRCSAISAILLIGCATSTADARQPATRMSPITVPDVTNQPSNPGRIALIAGGKRVEATVSVDRTTIIKGFREVNLLAQRGALAIVTDSNGSRPQGLSRCRSGSEKYARVIDVSTSKERFARLIESCLKPVYSGSPPITVSANRRSVKFDLLSGPPFTVTLGDNRSFSVKP